MKRFTQIALLLAVCCTAAAPISAAENPGRKKAQKLYRDGNFKEAYEAFSKLALNAKTEPKTVGGDLNMAVSSLQRLNRRSEIDAFREKVIKVHAKNWRLLHTAANSYLHATHYGYIISGEYHRGHHRGGGKRVNSYERDRVRALQLMTQAIPLTKNDGDHAGVGSFYMALADMMMGQRGYAGAWRLQYKTDLTKLPDYETGYYYGYGRYGRSSRGAPVDKNDKPIYHKRPKTWAAAKTDGEHWRWALLQAVEFSAPLRDMADFKFASFLKAQFGVETMGRYGRYFGSWRQPRPRDDGKKDTSGTYELHTLGEDETIARLAIGIRRFKLPDEYNFIRIKMKMGIVSPIHVAHGAKPLPFGNYVSFRHIEGVEMGVQALNKSRLISGADIMIHTHYVAPARARLLCMEYDTFGDRINGITEISITASCSVPILAKMVVLAEGLCVVVSLRIRRANRKYETAGKGAGL